MVNVARVEPDGRVVSVVIGDVLPPGIVALGPRVAVVAVLQGRPVEFFAHDPEAFAGIVARTEVRRNERRLAVSNGAVVYADDGSPALHH